MTLTVTVSPEEVSARSGCAVTGYEVLNPHGFGKGRPCLEMVTVRFKSHVDFPTGIWTTAVVVGDFNGDGKLDVIAVNGTCPGVPCGTTSSYVSVLLGNGDGTFQDPVDYTVGQLRPVSAVVGDFFNGDGKLDVAVSKRLRFHSSRSCWGMATAHSGIVQCFRSVSIDSKRAVEQASARSELWRPISTRWKVGFSSWLNEGVFSGAGQQSSISCWASGDGSNT